MNIILEGVVMDECDQQLVVLLFFKIVLEQVQDVPDLPEPTLFLSLQVQFGDNIAD